MIFMYDLTTERSSNLKATSVIDELGLFFDLLFMGVCITRHWCRQKSLDPCALDENSLIIGWVNLYFAVNLILEMLEACD